MTELEMILSIEVIHSLLNGDQIVFDIEEDGVRVVMTCDEKAVLTFRDQIRKAMLEFLPAHPSIN
jgi:hypothetical protein